MVTVKIGDLFESDAQTLVNTVNCVGVMGKGIALEFKKRFPDMFEEYAQLCRAGKVQLGRPYLYKRVTPPWILNFPTKDHWRGVSRLEDIIRGLEHLEANYERWGITSLAVPPLGSGQGQLEWRVVGPTLYRHLKGLDIPVELYAPFNTPHAELRPEFLDGRPEGPEHAPYKISPGWIAVVEILRRVEQEPYHWGVGRVMFQKIAYFVTVSGIPTGLQFQRGSYGPNAADLKRRISALVNNKLIEEEPRGKMLAVRVGPTFEDARAAYREQLDDWQPVIDKVADLFLRANTQQAEVAATVHFASKEIAETRRPSEQEILDAVMEWKLRRRPPLDADEVAMTIRHLNMLSWLDAEVSEELPVSEEELLYA